MQRAYLVLSALWIAAIVAISISDRPSPTTKVYLDDNGNPIPSFDDFVKAEPGGINGNPIPVPPPGFTVVGAKGSSGDLFMQRSAVLANEGSASGNRPVDLSRLSDEQLEASRSLLQKQQSEVREYWESRSALAFTPPFAGYAFLFGILPWIWRGFRSTQL